MANPPGDQPPSPAPKGEVPPPRGAEVTPEVPSRLRPLASAVETVSEGDGGEITRTMRILPRAARARVEVPTLRVVAGRDMLSFVTLHGAEEIVLGRDESAGMTLTDALVSRRHARVSMHEDQSVTIQDLGSTNGTSVNGVPVERSVLRPGDQLELGGVSLRLDMLSLEEIEHLANVVARLQTARAAQRAGPRARRA